MVSIGTNRRYAARVSVVVKGNSCKSVSEVLTYVCHLLCCHSSDSHLNYLLVNGFIIFVCVSSVQMSIKLPTLVSGGSREYAGKTTAGFALFSNSSSGSRRRIPCPTSTWVPDSLPMFFIFPILVRQTWQSLSRCVCMKFHHIQHRSNKNFINKCMTSLCI